ncbi:MAG: hypothetical protein NVSMB51_04710 [Solirubrobacteraceae bacterium]
MRARYGAGPLHLFAGLGSLLICGAAVLQWLASPDALRILIWFVAAAVAHDLVLLPLYSALDRLSGARGVGSWRVYLRVPLLLSGLLLLVFGPEILRLGNATYRTASGGTQNVYLIRFLLASGALFALSGAAYALRSTRS